MHKIPQRLYSAAQVRQHEPVAAEQAGVSMFSLMQRAGKAVYRSLCNKWPEAKHIIIAVGKGNNGGDGFIVAGLAKKDNLSVTLALAQADTRFTGDALLAAERWQAMGGQLTPIEEVEFSQADVIVDGLLGTGLSGAVRAPFDDIINRINAAHKPVLAIDIPSGIHADTGESLGCSIEASATVTFVGVKTGLVTGSGRQACGELEFSALGIGKQFEALADSAASWTCYENLKPLPKRMENAHKGSFGRLLCIGGSEGMPGAIRLTGEASLRTGAGLVKVFCHPSSQVAIAAGRPEVMVATDNLPQLLDWASCVVIGPGLGSGEWSQQTLRDALDYLKDRSKPVVMDADALNLVAKLQLPLSLQHLIVTPHPGEAARLLACDTQSVEQSRYDAVKLIAERYQAVAILKGAGSLICDGKQLWVCGDGNPGMATAGMGDVLTGIMGALLAQGVCESDAALRGVCLHAAVGDLAAKAGQRGMIASDILDCIRKLNN